MEISLTNSDSDTDFCDELSMSLPSCSILQSAGVLNEFYVVVSDLLNADLE